MKYVGLPAANQSSEYAKCQAKKGNHSEFMGESTKIISNREVMQNYMANIRKIMKKTYRLKNNVLDLNIHFLFKEKLLMNENDKSPQDR